MRLATTTGKGVNHHIPAEMTKDGALIQEPGHQFDMDCPCLPTMGDFGASFTHYSLRKAS